jgi:hypothetical protein
MKLSVQNLIIICLVSILPANAQMLNDSASLKMIHSCVDDIYNLKISDAKHKCELLFQKWPGHPVEYLFKGMITYWEYYPLITTSPSRMTFENDLRKCIELYDKSGKKEDPEYLLTNLCARGLLLLFYADNNLSSDVFPLVISSYRYIRRAFENTGSYADFYYYTGLYKYYREAYPRAYPVYKPLAILFPRGNIDEGLNELTIAAQKSIVLKAEALFFLTWIYMTFENNFTKSYDISKALYLSYPSNVCYQALFIENLLLNRQYDNAEQLIESCSGKTQSSYYQAQLLIFKGIIQEKKYNDLDQARVLYNEGIKEIVIFGNFGNDFTSFAYFGLSRINKAKNDRENYKMYRKKALDLSAFKQLNFD